MARQYTQRKKSGVRLYGFEEFLEALQKAESIDVDAAAKKCFNQCADIVVNALDERMSQTNVPNSLKDKAKKFRVVNGNYFMFAYGWNRTDTETFNKVCYLNYGTPMRETTKGYNRGKINARGFISNAKRSAAQKMKKVQQNALKEMTRGLQ